MFCFGRTCNAFLLKLYDCMVKTSSPLPNITGENPSGVVEGGILHLPVHLWGWAPGCAQHLGTVWAFGGATEDLCQCRGGFTSPHLLFHNSRLWAVLCVSCELQPAWTPGLASSWEKPLKIPGFWKLHIVVRLCYSSCNWSERVELARSCLAQVLSTLLLQQESYNGNWLKTLPAEVGSFLLWLHCQQWSIQALHFWLIKNVFVSCGCSSECQTYSLLLEGAV